MKPLTGTLDATATFCVRRWTLIKTPAFGGDALLTITQVKAKAVPDVEIEMYGIEELMPEFPRCRTFAVVNLSDDAQEQPYRCTVGAQQRCTCDAGRKGFRRSSCKHKDSLKAVTECGALPPKEVQGA